MGKHARVLALLAIGLLAAGCVNPFRPATPERPSGSAVVEDYSQPEDVLTTIQLAVAAGTDGASAYYNAFADSSSPGDPAFRAFYDVVAKTSYEQGGHTAPEPWTRQLEQLLFTYINGLRPTFTYQMAWGPDADSPNDDTPAGADTVQFHRHYLIVATSESGVTETIAAGFTDLSFFKSGGRWAITRWNDRADAAYGAPLSMSARRLESL